MCKSSKPLQQTDCQSGIIFSFLFTDSAGGVSKGCGIYFDGKWACLNWSSEWEQRKFLKDITYLELNIRKTVKIF
jgi:hypothetical protein